MRTRPRPSRIEDLTPAAPAPAPAPAPVAPVSPALPPAPPQAQAAPTGVLITDIECPEREGLQLYPKVTTGKCHDHTLNIVMTGGQL